VGEEPASLKEAMQKTEEQDATQAQMEPPTRAIEGAAAAIERPASHGKTGDANSDVPSRFPALTGPGKVDPGLAEDAQMELGPPRRERSPFLHVLQTPRARVIFAACAGVVIAAVMLVVMPSQWQTNLTKEHTFVNSLGMRFVSVPGTNVLFSVWETRVKDYQAFSEAAGRSWTKPTFSQTGDDPAVNVDWKDATAFCEWLSRKEGKKYRLPTDHEWSCAVGIGDSEDAEASPRSKDNGVADVFPWGKQWPPPDDAGNYFGEECNTAAALADLKAAGVGWNSSVIVGFNDGKVFTASAGSFRPNGFGIYDLGGNVWEWCEDDYEPGAALWSGSRALRGGSWNDGGRTSVLSSFRNGLDPAARRAYVGFRAVVEAGSGR
jgi:formylglycine-generating enzyme required for sulfatase activity